MSNTDDHEPEMLELATRIGDDEPVDWETTERTLPGYRERIARLRAVEAIGKLHAAALEAEIADRTAPAIGGWGPLDLLELAAEGGFGEVYRARDRTLDRIVALKLLPEDRDEPARRAAFIREAKRLAQVHHKNVVTIHGADRFDERSGLWMEWIDGDSLHEIVDRQGPLGAREAANVGIELCRALAAVHRTGLVHRDIKLSNVMRERGERPGRIVLMDFGSATRSGHFATDDVSGTPAYVAPEVFEGRDSGTALDVYALGVALYRLTSDGFPIDPSGRAEDLRQRHREGRRTRLLDRNPDLPATFVQIVEKAIDPDPGKRFFSAGDFESALSAFLGGMAEQPTETAPVPTARRPAWKRWLPAAAALPLLLLAGWWVATLIGPATLDAEATFYLYDTESQASRLLADGMSVATGDQLYLQLDTDQELWVYVVNEDSAGAEFLMFPLEHAGYTNPVAGDGSGSVRLPDASQNWMVTSDAYEDRIVVIASRTRLPKLENVLNDLVVAGSNVLPEGSEFAQRLRGIGGLSEPRVPAQVDPGSTIDSVYRQIALESGKGRDVRAWELTLRNR